MSQSIFKPTSNRGSYEDVRDYADRILERLRRGSMPCDGAWPREQVEVFERWVRGGTLP